MRGCRDRARLRGPVARRRPAHLPAPLARRWHHALAAAMSAIPSACTAKSALSTSRWRDRERLRDQRNGEGRQLRWEPAVDDRFPSFAGEQCLNATSERVVLPGHIWERSIISMWKWRLWCARRDSNPHGVTHCHLKAARLPIPPRALRMSDGTLRRRRIEGAM